MTSREFSMDHSLLPVLSLIMGADSGVPGTSPVRGALRRPYRDWATG